MVLTKALTAWPLKEWHELPDAVDEALRRLQQGRGMPQRL